MRYINIADSFVSPKQNMSFIDHYAMYLGFLNGIHYVIENQINHGVRLIKLIDFQKQHPDYKVVPFKGTEQERLNVINRAKAKLGKSYNPVFYNCETFVNDVQYQKPESKQVQTAVKFVAFGLLTVGILKGISKR